MELDHPEARTFLEQLYSQTEGDMNHQVSMYDIGATLGLEKSEAGSLAEMLFMQGFAELKTLSGGIGITLQGISALGKKADADNSDGYVLGPHRILTQEDREAVEEMIDAVKNLVPDTNLVYDRMNELIIDIKTIEVQLLSENPKTNIIRELLNSIADNLAEKSAPGISDKIRVMTGSDS